MPTRKNQTVLATRSRVSSLNSTYCTSRYAAVSVRKIVCPIHRYTSRRAHGERSVSLPGRNVISTNRPARSAAATSGYAPRRTYSRYSSGVRPSVEPRYRTSSTFSTRNTTLNRIRQRTTNAVIAAARAGDGCVDTTAWSATGALAECQRFARARSSAQADDANVSQNSIRGTFRNSGNRHSPSHAQPNAQPIHPASTGLPQANSATNTLASDVGTTHTSTPRAVAGEIPCRARQRITTLLSENSRIHPVSSSSDHRFTH